MPRLRIVGILVAVIALAGAIFYGELVRDWRVPRSDQTARHALSTTYGLSLVAYNKLLAEMKQQYGDRASTNMDLQTGIIQVVLDGEVIETRAETKALADVYGIIMIGPKDTATTRFPFRLAADQNPASPDRSVRDMLKNHFKRAPQEWFEFTDQDWTIDRCAPLPRGLGLGFVGEGLRLREGISCVATWKAPQPGSMLISVSRADGDPWMRPFTRRLCRAITEAALKRFEPAQPDSPNYAACILADRPVYASAQRSLVMGVYSVGSSCELALMEWTP